MARVGALPVAHLDAACRMVCVVAARCTWWRHGARGGGTVRVVAAWGGGRQIAAGATRATERAEALQGGLALHVQVLSQHMDRLHESSVNFAHDGTGLRAYLHRCCGATAYTGWSRYGWDRRRGRPVGVVEFAGPGWTEPHDCGGHGPGADGNGDDEPCACTGPPERRAAPSFQRGTPTNESAHDCAIAQRP